MNTTLQFVTYLLQSKGLVGSGNEKIFLETDSEVNNSFITTSGKNYFAISPLTIASGSVLTITSESELEFF